MATFWIGVVRRAAWDTWSTVTGLDTLIAVLLPVGITIASLIVYGIWQGWPAAARDLGKPALAAVAGNVLIGSLLFGWFVLRTPPVLQQELEMEYQQKIVSRKLPDIDLPTLAEPPKTATSETSTELRVTVDKLQAALDQRFRNRGICSQLGLFIEEGQRLARRVRNEKAPPPTDDANEWAGRVEQYLRRELGDGFVGRFRSGAGLPLMANSIASNEHANLWAGIQVRLARLEQFSAKVC